MVGLYDGSVGGGFLVSGWGALSVCVWGVNIIYGIYSSIFPLLSPVWSLSSLSVGCPRYFSTSQLEDRANSETDNAMAQARYLEVSSQLIMPWLRPGTWR